MSLASVIPRCLGVSDISWTQKPHPRAFLTTTMSTKRPDPAVALLAVNEKLPDKSLGRCLWSQTAPCRLCPGRHRLARMVCQGQPFEEVRSYPLSPFNSLFTLGPYLAPFSLTENTYTALAAWEEDIINGPVPGIGFPSLSFVNSRCCASFSAGKMTGDDLRVEKLRMQLLSQFVIFYFAFE